MTTVVRSIRRLAGLLALGIALAGMFAGLAWPGTGVPTGMTAQEWRALQLRSDALDRKYHLGRYAVVRPTVAPAAFDWTDAGIGSAATAGAGLAALGATALVKRKSAARDRSHVAV